MKKKKKVKNNVDVLGIISLVLGILSVLLYFVSVLLPISAISFGAISLIKNKNKFAIIGLILGIVFTFQYINVNYLIPELKNEKEGISNKSNNNEKNRETNVISRAKSYGFECSDIECHKNEYTNTNILEEYTINIDGEYITKSFQMDLGYGQIMDVEARYGYNNGVLICASVLENYDNPNLIEYKSNVITGEKSCNYSTMEECSFNISIANGLVQYFNNMMK